eukprot:NODE_13354_length_1170_cov_8.813998.p1 GENE.NODE_13354_length_1170_cov_8.813998~~NODE_13354_length_1170_cov_8.813998.p1  ORF type:complete len:270 (-),score=57.74 NODE_13354_length_1170_cov_8.813998:268-1077(-)
MSGGITAVKHAHGIAVVTLASEPTNTMTREFWLRLDAMMTELEEDLEVRAVIIRSGLRRPIFTAGLNFREIYRPTTDEAGVYKLWEAASTCLRHFYISKFVTVMAIRGHCPAGGCALALCSDHRIAMTDTKMGFNEVSEGMGGVPKYWCKLLETVIGKRPAEIATTSGTLYPSAKLLELGWVDEVVENTDALLAHAINVATKSLQAPDTGRRLTKNAHRMDFHNEWKNGHNEEVGQLWSDICNKTLEGRMKALLERFAEAAASKKKAKL